MALLVAWSGLRLYITVAVQFSTSRENARLREEATAELVGVYNLGFFGGVCVCFISFHLFFYLRQGLSSCLGTRYIDQVVFEPLNSDPRPFAFGVLE